MTAYLVLVIILLYYVLVFDPELDPYQSKDLPLKKLERVNPVDRVFHRFTHIRVSFIKQDATHEVEKVFQKASRKVFLRKSPGK